MIFLDVFLNALQIYFNDENNNNNIIIIKRFNVQYKNTW